MKEVLHGAPTGAKDVGGVMWRVMITWGQGGLYRGCCIRATEEGAHRADGCTRVLCHTSAAMRAPAGFSFLSTPLLDLFAQCCILFEVLPMCLLCGPTLVNIMQSVALHTCHKTGCLNHQQQEADSFCS